MIIHESSRLTCVDSWSYPFHGYCDPTEVSESITIEKVKNELQELLLLDIVPGMETDLRRRLMVLLQNSREVESLNIAFLMSVLGCKLNGIELHGQAEHLHRRALCIGVKCLGPDHPDLANSMEWLAFSLYKQSSFKEAVLLCYSTIVLVHESVGPFHLRTANCYYNLAMIIEAMGLFDHAHVLREKGFSLLTVFYPYLHHYWWDFPRAKDPELYEIQRKQENWNYMDPVFYSGLMMPCHETTNQMINWIPTGISDDHSHLYSNGTIATY